VNIKSIVLLRILFDLSVGPCVLNSELDHSLSASDQLIRRFQKRTLAVDSNCFPSYGCMMAFNTCFIE